MKATVEVVENGFILERLQTIRRVDCNQINGADEAVRLYADFDENRGCFGVIIMLIKSLVPGY